MQPTQVHRNTSQNGARAKIMRALYTEGMLPITEVCELCGLTAKQARDNLGAARNDGLVVGERDDVTQRLGFKLTPDGKKWVTDRDLHLKNSKASQEADTADATEAAAAIGDAIEDTTQEITEDAQKTGANKTRSASVKDRCELRDDLYVTLSGYDPIGDAEVWGSLQEAIDAAKLVADSSDFDIPVYRLVPIGMTRTTVDFIQLREFS